jgi:hypothetical protein
MDAAALDAVPELCRQTRAAIDRLAALIAATAPAAEIVFAAAELADFRASWERSCEVVNGSAGLFASMRRQSLREGAARRDAELAAARETGGAPPVRLVAG